MDKKKAKKTWMWLVPLAGLMAAAVPLRENYFELSKQLEIMTAMFRELNIYYVDEIQPGQLMETGMDAMVEITKIPKNTALSETGSSRWK